MASRSCKFLLRNIDNTAILSYSSKVLFQKLTVLQLVKKFPSFYVHYRFHICLPPVPILSQTNPVYDSPPTSWKSISILFSHLHLGLTSEHFPSGSPTKSLYMPPHSPLCDTCPAHHILLDLITWKILSNQYKYLSSSLCSFLHSPVTSSLLGPNIPLNTILSNTLSLRSSLNVSGQVSHPYKTTAKLDFCIS